MRRRSLARTTGFAIAVVVGAGVLFQLPASPFARHGYPERGVVPASVQAAESAPPEQAPARSVVSQRPPAPPAEVITYPLAGTQSYAVLPADPAVIGRAGKLMRFRIAIEGGITGIDRAGFARFGGSGAGPAI